MLNHYIFDRIRDSSDDQLIARKEFVPIDIDIYKEEEAIIEEKPKEEERIREEITLEEKIPEEEIIPEEITLEEKMPEEEIPKERMLEKEILEEKMLEDKIPEEREKEKIDEIIVEKKDKTVQTDDEFDESSSESIYSYSMYIICFYMYIYITNACLF